MNDASALSIILSSVALGGLASLVLRMIPSGHRAREWVILAGFASLGLLVAGLIVPLPRFHLGLVGQPDVASVSVERTGRWISIHWFAGVAISLSRTLVARWLLRSVLKSSRPAEDVICESVMEEARCYSDWHEPVELRIASSFGPAALGIRRRIILLPEASRFWSLETLRYVLTHELTHFRRQDPLKHWFVRLLCAVHWFNPFAQMLRRTLETERELACDRLAARAGDPASYGECLVSLAEGRVPALQPALTIRPEGRGQLECRIRNLFTTSPELRRAECVLVAMSLILLIAFCFVSPFARSTSGKWSRAEISKRLSAEAFPGNP